MFLSVNNNRIVPERILYLTEASLAKIDFTTDDISNITKNLDSKKSHGHDNTSIRILKFVVYQSTNLLKLFLKFV